MARGKTRPPRFRFNLICPNKLLCPSWLRPCLVALASNRKGESRVRCPTDAGQWCRDSCANQREFMLRKRWRVAGRNAEVSTTASSNGDLIPRHACVSYCDAPIEDVESSFRLEDRPLAHACNGTRVVLVRYCR